jgi:hypothetical protein
MKMVDDAGCKYKKAKVYLTRVEERFLRQAKEQISRDLGRRCPDSQKPIGMDDSMSMTRVATDDGTHYQESEGESDFDIDL